VAISCAVIASAARQTRVLSLRAFEESAAISRAVIANDHALLQKSGGARQTRVLSLRAQRGNLAYCHCELSKKARQSHVLSLRAQRGNLIKR